MSKETERVLVREVHNFGGFFGGDTVTLTATPHDAPDDEQTLTIDEKALTNIADRHTVMAGMLFDLTRAGERIDAATLLGAATADELRTALGPVEATGPLDEPQILSYHCPNCNLWVAGPPAGATCRVCGGALT